MIGKIWNRWKDLSYNFYKKRGWFVFLLAMLLICDISIAISGFLFSKISPFLMWVYSVCLACLLMYKVMVEFG